jgi:hypothetical protein
MELKSGELRCTKCQRFANDAPDLRLRLAVYISEVYEVWEARQDLLERYGKKPRHPLGQLKLDQDRNRLNQDKVACEVELFCDECYERQQVYEAGVPAYVNRYSNLFIHRDILNGWRQIINPNQRVLPWHQSHIMARLARDGHPYVEALIPVDGREVDDYRKVLERRPSLLSEGKSLSQLPDPITMPASYVLLLAEPGRLKNFAVISRYLKCPEFANFIQVYVVTFRQRVDLQHNSQRIGEALSRVVDEKTSTPYTVVISQDAHKKDRSHERTLLVSLIRRFDGNNHRGRGDVINMKTVKESIAWGLMNQESIGRGRMDPYKCLPDIVEIENTLTQVVEKELNGDFRGYPQGPTPLSSAIQHLANPLAGTNQEFLTYGIQEESVLPIESRLVSQNDLAKPKMALMVNCIRVGPGKQVIGYIEETDELFQVTSTTNCCVPLVVQQKRHAKNLLNFESQVDVLDTLYIRRG